MSQIYDILNNDMAMYGGISIGIFIHLGALCYWLLHVTIMSHLFILGAWLHFLMMPVIICIVHEASWLVSYMTKKECFIGLILVEYSYGLIDVCVHVGCDSNPFDHFWCRYIIVFQTNTKTKCCNGANFIFIFFVL